jgi:hypothetical protein
MSERIRASDRADSDHKDEEFEGEVHDDTGVHPKKEVRESSELQIPTAVPSPTRSQLAHPSNRLTVQLNTNWRVIDDPLQWVLQRRKGNPRKKNSGWQDRSFCTTRDGLLRCIRELCGVVDQQALDELQALPDFHSAWEASR